MTFSTSVSISWPICAPVAELAPRFTVIDWDALE